MGSNQQYHCSLTGKVKTGNHCFIGKGGQASVFSHRGYALKIYHDQAGMVPVAKLRELQSLSPDNVLKPLDILLDRRDQPVGYVMTYCADCEPLCRLFANGFKRQRGIGQEHVIALLKDLQGSLAEIHKNGFLVVDLNEFNILVKPSWEDSIFIDVDSYQTPNFQAAALMESVSDPQVINNQFSELSDWYSFAVLAFQLYIGIHPFKGRHPNYGKGSWQRRMRDGASAFDTGVRLPPACNDLSVIPKAHAGWLRDVLSGNNRSVPPMPDQLGSVCIPFVTPRTIQTTGDYVVTQVTQLPETPQAAFNGNGMMSFLTPLGFWQNGKLVRRRTHALEYMLFSGTHQVHVGFDGKALQFSAISGELIHEEPADQLLFRDGTLFGAFEDSLFEYELTTIGSRVLVSKRHLCSFIAGRARFFDGLVVQETLDRHILVVPHGQGRCAVRTVPELSEYRIIDAIARGNAVVVLAEKDGAYHRLVIVFADDFQSYEIRRTVDVEEMNLSLASLPGGVCVLPVEEENVEVFRDTKTVRTMTSAPFGPEQILFTTSKGLHFIDHNVIYHVSARTGR